MSELERDPLHELLCAWLLGEASAEETRRVEAALAEDADLRAERARLESVLGLVRTSLGDPERLSDESLQELLARASGHGGHAHSTRDDHAHDGHSGDGHAHDGHAAPILPGPGWGGHGLLRAAAAVLVLGGGVWAVLQQSGAGDGDEDRVAYVDTRVAPTGPSAVLLQEVEAVRERVSLERRGELLEQKLLEAESGVAEVTDRERQGLYFARAVVALEQDQPELAVQWAELGQQVDLGYTLRATDVPRAARLGEGAAAPERAEAPAEDASRIDPDGHIASMRGALYDPSDSDAYAGLKLALAEAADERLAGTRVQQELELAAAGGAQDVSLGTYGLDARIERNAAEDADAGDETEALGLDGAGVPVTGGLQALGYGSGEEAPPVEVLDELRRLRAESRVPADGATVEPNAERLGREGVVVTLPTRSEGRSAGSAEAGNELSVLTVGTAGGEGGKFEKGEPAPSPEAPAASVVLPEASRIGLGGGAGGASAPRPGAKKSADPGSAGPATPKAANGGPTTPGPAGPSSPGPVAPGSAHSPGPAGVAGGDRTRHSPGMGAYRGAGDAVPPDAGGGGGGGGRPPVTPGPDGTIATPESQAGRPAADPTAPRREAEVRARSKTAQDKVAEVAEVELSLQERRYAKDVDVEIAQAATIVEAPGESTGEADASGSDDFFLGQGDLLVGGQPDDARVDRGRSDGTRPDDGRGVRSRPEPLDPERVRQEVDRRITHIRQDCLRRPDERPRDMFFRWWGDNPWEVSERDRLSTFAADVDTASYVLARRYLRDGLLPERAQVRTEEFVNYFRPDLAAPHQETFAVTSELAPSPFGGSERRWMLRVGVRGKEVQAYERDPLAITFVLDVSGSMKENGRLELVKHAIRLLVSQLDARDSVALVVFNREARLVLPMTSAAQRGVIESALHPLTPDGGTNAEAGLTMGYEVAGAALTAGAHNRVVLLSDGVANVGQTDQDRINESVRRQRERGIYLNTIGVGMNNHSDVFLEQLANKGDGICDYVDDARAAERAIVERFTGAFTPIASDVKIQVEFDPSQVLRYRLLGYENRAVADQDFRNDAVDAGEVGAGHQVTALYELERAAGLGGAQPLATVRLRWKEPKAAGQDPREVQVFEREHAVRGGEGVAHFDSGSLGYRRAVLAAQLAEFLRRSTHARGDSVEALVAEVQRLADHPTYVADPDTQELLWMARRASELGLARAQVLDELDGTVDEYRRYRYLREQLEELEGELRVEELRVLEETNEDLERRIRELLEREVRRGR